MSLSHSKLIELTEKLGYRINKEGMCCGVAIVGVQAILADNVSSLDNCCHVMAVIDTNLFPSYVTAIENKIKNFMQDCKEELLTKWNFQTPFYHDEYFYSALLRNSSDEAVVHYKTSIENVHHSSRFTMSERALIGARAFLKGVSEYFFSEKFPQIVDQAFIPIEPDAMFTFSRVSPLALIDQRIVKDEKNNKIYIEEKSKVEKIASFRGTYFPFEMEHYLLVMYIKMFDDVFGEKFEILRYKYHQLHDYFFHLRTKLNWDKPVAFILTSPTINNVPGHAITITYKASIKKWLLIDSNKLPTKLFNTDKEIACAVLDSFLKEEVVQFKTEVYTTTSHAKITQEALQKCFAHPQWKGLHHDIVMSVTQEQDPNVSSDIVQPALVSKEQKSINNLVKLSVLRTPDHSVVRESTQECCYLKQNKR